MKGLALKMILLSAFLQASTAGIASEQSGAKIQPAIRVPFARLQADPDKFEKRVVTAVAYLAIDRGILKAYPSRDAFVFDDQSSAVSLRGDYKSLKRWAGFNRSYVLITGTFHRLEHEGRAFALGELTDFRVIIQIDGEKRLKDPDNAMLLRDD